MTIDDYNAMDVSEQIELGDILLRCMRDEKMRWGVCCHMQAASLLLKAQQQDTAADYIVNGAVTQYVRNFIDSDRLREVI